MDTNKKWITLIVCIFVLAGVAMALRFMGVIPRSVMNLMIGVPGGIILLLAYFGKNKEGD